MRILLVDDDHNKVSQVRAFVSEFYPTHDITVTRSFQSGLKTILLGNYDVILLDMTMPTYDVDSREPGGRERRYAGKEILRQMERRGLAIPTIIITQYEQFEEGGREITLSELVRVLKIEFPRIFRGSVYYQASTSDWMKELQMHLNSIIKKGESE